MVARGRELGLQIEPDAARALIRHVGERQQRLLRELEKLALGAAPTGRVELDEIEELTAPSAERRAWALADAIVTGEAAPAARTYLALRAQGERLPGLIYWMAQRLRTAYDAAQALEAGESAAHVKRRLRMPSRAADRLISDAQRVGTERLRGAIEQIADLELASRGGASGIAAEDTAALTAIERIGEPA